MPTPTPSAPRVGPPYRADHVGSLLRPKHLMDARAQRAAGRISAEALTEVEDGAIREVVRMQESLGLRAVTDGEFRRSSWAMDFIYGLGGIEKADDEITLTFRSAEGELEFSSPAIAVTSRIGLPATIFGDHFAKLAALARTGTPKLTIPSPSMVHFRGGPAAIDSEVYPDPDEFWNDLIDAYRSEVEGLGELGCRYLQFDDVSLAYLNDPAQRRLLAQQGADAEHQHEAYIRNLNRALDGRPPGMSVTMHMCRGNFRSSWVADGGYDFVAEPLFTELNVDGFFLEYDDIRSGGFAPLRFMPKGKRVVLGLVTTKRGNLEHKDAIKRRIEEATAFVPIEQICLSPQCGFSSTVDGNQLTLDEQVAKLRLVVEVAEEVWGTEP